MDNYLIAAYLIGYDGFMIYAILELDDPFLEEGRAEYAKSIALCMLFALFWPAFLMAGIFKKILG